MVVINLFPFIKKAGTKVLSFITGLSQRLLTLFSLFITVICCVTFIYGLYIGSNFHCLFSILGIVAFTWVNKQT